MGDEPIQNPTPSELKEVPSFQIPQEFFERRGRILSVINQKGGCGKTTTAINVSAALSREGFQVLVIDLDAQANATIGFGIQLDPQEKNIYHLFKERSLQAADLIRPTYLERLHLIPSSRSVAALAAELLTVSNWQYLLRGHLRTLQTLYHYILIDCPPALNALTVNALTASEDMVIPLQTHFFSLEGMKELFVTVQGVRQYLNPLLKNGMILPTLYDRRTKISKEMLLAIREYFTEQVLETVIGINVRLIESVMQGKSVLTYDPTSSGARDYHSLARELIRRELSTLTPAPR